ncbi:hypothetical protein GCM10009796_25350 [Microbacterium koreense]
MTSSDPTGTGPVPVDAAGAPPVFPPTLREVMLRPRWIAMLLLCLVVAGVFAWLGQWQLSNAIDTDPPPPGATEQVRPLEEVSEPGVYLPDPLVGQRVEVTGRWIAEDFLVVEGRYNDGVEGYWVTGQLRIADLVQPTSVAVALGWAPSLDAATRAAGEFATTLGGDVPVTLTGRLIADEGPFPPDDDVDPFTMNRMSPAALLSRWHDAEGLDVYRSYIASELAPEPLVDIASPPPLERSSVNWLNIFYAIEWAIFAGFAFYLWYRLAKDAWEKELEDLEDESAEARG